MKKLLSVLVVLLLWLNGCTIKREVIQPAGNNFSTDILRLIPAETIAKVRELGITIYDGRTPPIIDGAYLIARNYMTKSSVPNEAVAADGFADLKIKIYNQNRTKLTASLDTKTINQNTGNVISTATGQGTYLSGNGNFFSLFVVLETTKTSNNSRSRTLNVYSGELTSAGIRNLEYTLFLLDDYGDPNNDLIPVNTGRAFQDRDGLSERISNFRLAAPEHELNAPEKAAARTPVPADGQ